MARRFLLCWKTFSCTQLPRARITISGTIKTQVDCIWDAFWSGGISNPMEVLEQLTYLPFIKRLDDIPAIKAELPFIQAVQTESYWQDITLPMLEQLRRRLRGLVRLIERQSVNVVYSVLQDAIGEAQGVTLVDTSAGVNMAQYRKKV